LITDAASDFETVKTISGNEFELLRLARPGIWTEPCVSAKNDTVELVQCISSLLESGKLQGMIVSSIAELSNEVAPKERV